MQKTVLIAALAAVPMALFAPRTARAGETAHAPKPGVVTKTTTDGAYTITLKVLPAETFKGPNAAMAADGGAAPLMLDSSVQPNHHLVAFVKKDGKPVENAKVRISYRETFPQRGTWLMLPVVRMHVKGKSLATTHYGNNVELPPGSYQARVIVDGGTPADFRFELKRKA